MGLSSSRGGAGSSLLDCALVAELFAADTIVIGMPIYNFGPPAALTSVGEGAPDQSA